MMKQQLPEKKQLAGKRVNRIWLVLFLSSFFVYFVLLSVDCSTTLVGGIKGIAYILNNFADSINSTTTGNSDRAFILQDRNPPAKTKTSFVNNVTESKQDESVYSVSNVKNKNDSIRNSTDSCLGRYIYVSSLPNRFNNDILRNCRSLIKWFDMCPYMENSGLGRKIENDPDGILSNMGWFSTNQFTLELIFRERMKQYECLTDYPSLASAIYVPYFPGLDVGRYLWDNNTSMRDSLPYDVVKQLSSKPEWKRMWGRDHFYVAGRIAWDFRRRTDGYSDWGSKLMLLPQSMNMTMLSIESTSWSNEFAIPYPTYFHPSSVTQTLEWQNRMRIRKRKYLFSFAGAPRPSSKDSIRGEIIKQCLSLTSNNTCKLLDCSYSGGFKCDNPVEVIRVFQDSVFCLQPAGDSYTRRSAFDSILVGCIPVFFHPGSAYAQYVWYLPNNYSKYSVFISENDIKGGNISIKDVLLGFSDDKIKEMREEVIGLIPKIVYADPRKKLENIEEDAFTIAIKGVIERVNKVRRDMKEGKDPSVGFAQENSWKMKLNGTVGVEEFGKFFYF